MVNVFGDLFNPKKRIIYKPFAKDNKLQTVTTGNTAGNVGSTYQSILPKTNTTKVTSPYGMSTNRGVVNYNIKPSQPTVPKVSTIPSQPETDFNTKYQNYLTETAKRKSDLAKKAYEEDVASARELGASTEAGLKEDITSMEDYLGKYSKGQLERAEKRKEAVRTEQGSGQRRLAEQRRQQKAQNERQYAALGTIDSYGTGSFTQANENVESDFSRLSAESQAALEDKLFSIDSDTEDKIAAEESKFNSEVRKIRQLLAGNTAAQNQAIRQAYLKYESNVSDIQAESEGLKLQAEQEQLKNQSPELSEEFMRTGVPQTMNDFIYRTKNPGAFETKIGGNIAGNQAKNEILDVAQKLSGSDIAPITGLAQIRSVIPGTKAKYTASLYDQLKGMLSLENRQKLRGQGQISDFESKLLANAATALNRNLSESDFRNVLNELITKLGGTGQEQTIRVRVKSTGQTGILPQSEFDPNIYEQI